ncbi:MAG: hypothetical protein MRQ09_00605 [Candidatus Midichloria sp.]|nr:hypothetical protein [Candidatus Midichloria sp.]
MITLGIKLKQEEAEKLSEMTIYGVRYFIKSFLYFLVCHKDIDEIYRLCDGMLMSTVLSGITGGIAYSITSPALYNNEDDSGFQLLII